MSTEMSIEYLWSNGDKPVRSYKSDKPSGENSNFNNRTNEVGEYYMNNPHDTHEQHTQQHTQHSSNSSQVQYALEQTEKDEPSGKRDDMNDKLTQRMPVASVSINPFLRQSNYLQDMETRDNFLIPKNSNQETSTYKKD